MDNLEMLYDHYKETFSLNKEAQNRRNKSFIVLCVLEAVSFFILIRPEKAFELIHDGINKEISRTLQLSNTIIQTLLWIIIAYVLVRYIQDMLYVERQYRYLNELEKQIVDLSSVSIFKREGEFYKRNYPMVLNFIDLFYKMLMPVFFMVINLVRICQEWVIQNKVIISLICDTVLFFAIFIITWFYFFEIHTKITAFFKKYIPFIDKISKKLRQILKEV